MSKHTPLDLNATIFGSVVELKYVSHSEAFAQLRLLREQLAQRGELLSALQLCFKALDAIGDEMTFGERYTNAGQYLLDALEPARAAIARATQEQAS